MLFYVPGVMVVVVTGDSKRRKRNFSVSSKRITKTKSKAGKGLD